MHHNFQEKFVTRNTIHMCCKFNLVKYWLPNCFLLATIMYVIYVGDFLSSWWIYDINIFCRIILSKTKHSLLYIFFYYLAAFVLEHMALLLSFLSYAVNSYCMKCRYLYFRIMHSFLRIKGFYMIILTDITKYLILYTDM